MYAFLAQGLYARTKATLPSIVLSNSYALTWSLNYADALVISVHLKTVILKVTIMNVSSFFLTSA